MISSIVAKRRERTSRAQNTIFSVYSTPRSVCVQCVRIRRGRWEKKTFSDAAAASIETITTHTHTRQRANNTKYPK